MANESTHLELLKINNTELSNYLSVENRNIYHYTSPTGLNGIISHHTLRFTDRNFLNDYSEGRYVIDLCLHSKFETNLPKEHRAYFKEYCRKLYDNPYKKKRYIYQCSFSTQNDNLSLWNYYTKSDGIKGYNLGFNSVELAENLKTQADSKGRRINVCHGKIVYSKNTQKAIIKQIVNDFKEIIEKHKADIPFCHLAIEVLLEKIIFVGAFFKAPCFKHESEYRLLLHLIPIWDSMEERIKFMVLEKAASTYEKNGLLIPYVDIEFPQENLKAISISPTLSFKETENNLTTALKLHNYENTIKISKSDIPVRY